MVGQVTRRDVILCFSRGIVLEWSNSTCRVGVFCNIVYLLKKKG